MVVIVSGWLGFGFLGGFVLLCCFLYEFPVLGCGICLLVGLCFGVLVLYLVFVELVV